MNREDAMPRWEQHRSLIRREHLSYGIQHILCAARALHEDAGRHASDLAESSGLDVLVKLKAVSDFETKACSLHAEFLTRPAALHGYQRAAIPALEDFEDDVRSVVNAR